MTGVTWCENQESDKVRKWTSKVRKWETDSSQTSCGLDEEPLLFILIQLLPVNVIVFFYYYFFGCLR